MAFRTSSMAVWRTRWASLAGFLCARDSRLPALAFAPPCLALEQLSLASGASAGKSVRPDDAVSQLRRLPCRLLIAAPATLQP
eukprot:11170912-Lingulodinium_polyedra.AAC.1